MNEMFLPKPLTPEEWKALSELSDSPGSKAIHPDLQRRLIALGLAEKASGGLWITDEGLIVMHQNIP